MECVSNKKYCVKSYTFFDIETHLHLQVMPVFVRPAENTTGKVQTLSDILFEIKTVLNKNSMQAHIMCFFILIFKNNETAFLVKKMCQSRNLWVK